MKIHVALSAVLVLTIGLTKGEKIDSLIPCRNTSDCMSITTLPRNAYCKDGYCMCTHVDKEVRNCSSIDASIHERRTAGPLVFRVCKFDHECEFHGGFCNTTISQCNCLKDYLPLRNHQRCVEKILSIDHPCVDGNQCLALLANTTCQGNKCTCVPGYHLVNNTCLRMAGYGQPCTKDEECTHIEGVICTNNVTCACKAETVLNEEGKRCLEVKRFIGDACAESVQCATTIGNSSCVNETCQCQKDYHYGTDKKSCYLNKGSSLAASLSMFIALTTLICSLPLW